MREAVCHGDVLEEAASVEKSPQVIEFVPASVRAVLDKALSNLVEEIRGLGTDSCLRQALEESDLRLSVDGWTFRIRTRQRALQVVAATPK